MLLRTAPHLHLGWTYLAPLGAGLLSALASSACTAGRRSAPDAVYEQFDTSYDDVDATHPDGPPRSADADAAPLTYAAEAPRNLPEEGPWRAHTAPLRTVVPPDVPDDAPRRFDAATALPARLPLLHPAHGTVLPPNVPSLVVQTDRAENIELVELTFVGERGTVRVYDRCAETLARCAVRLRDDAREQIVAAAGDAARVTLRVAALSTANTVRYSARHELHFTREPLRGALYYWSTVGAILRYEFGQPSPTPERFLPREDNQGCHGCHTLSRSGERIAVGVLRNDTTRDLLSYDLASDARVSLGGIDSFVTYSPDGTLALVNSDFVTRLRRADTGAPLLDAPFPEPAAMPDWSPDGAHVVVAVPAPGRRSASFGFEGAASLALVSWDGARFGALRTLVPAQGRANYYPCFSPDGRWVLFNRSSSTTNSAPDAQLWAVAAEPASDGAARPALPLRNANGFFARSNSWPRFAPHRDTLRGEPVLWLTYSSSAWSFAFRSAPQLTMAAFFPERAARGEEPSAPGFWLSFQAPDVGNHLAQWSELVPRRACEADTDCAPRETCQRLASAGRCYPRE